jgi:hypothetical protein
MLLLTLSRWRGDSVTSRQLLGCAAITRAGLAGGWANYVAVVRDGMDEPGALWIVGHRRRLGIWPLVERVAYDRTHSESRLPVPQDWTRAAEDMHALLDGFRLEAGRPSCEGSSS